VNKATEKGWDFQQIVPTQLKNQLKEIKKLFIHLERKAFCKQSQSADSFRLFNNCLGRVRRKTGEIVKGVWRKKASLHINVKELEAAICSVKSLASKTKQYVCQ
jgi:hypothetical protein